MNHQGLFSSGKGRSMGMNISASNKLLTRNAQHGQAKLALFITAA